MSKEEFSAADRVLDAIRSRERPATPEERDAEVAAMMVRLRQLAAQPDDHPREVEEGYRLVQRYEVWFTHESQDALSAFYREAIPLMDKHGVGATIVDCCEVEEEISDWDGDDEMEVQS
jgi:hypothetical protein